MFHKFLLQDDFTGCNGKGRRLKPNRNPFLLSLGKTILLNLFFFLGTGNTLKDSSHGFWNLRISRNSTAESEDQIKLKVSGLISQMSSQLKGLTSLSVFNLVIGFGRFTFPFRKKKSNELRNLPRSD